MKAMQLSASQADYLRQQPLGSARNKVAMALGLFPGRTQSELATLARLTDAEVSDIRNGKYKRLSLDMAQRLSAVFGICTDDLFPREATSRRKVVKTKARGKAPKAVAA